MTDRRPTQYAAGTLAASVFVAGLPRVARRVRTLPDRSLDSTKLSKASYDQERRVEVQVPDTAHLLDVASLVLGDVSDPDL